MSTLVNYNGHVNKNYGLLLKTRGRITAVQHHLAKYIMILLIKQTFLIFISICTRYCDTTSTYARASLPDMSPIGINCDGVTQLLVTLDVYKATDPNHIPSHLLKDIFRNSTTINCDLPSIILHPCYYFSFISLLPREKE